MNKLYIAKYVSILVAILAAMFNGGCEKELDITQFSDDYSTYRPELRIEAVLHTYHPDRSIVRLDRTITVDDTTIFNGRDDDGDWITFTDLNGNGQWDKGEPLNDDLGEDGIEGQPNGFPLKDEGEGNGRPDQGEPHVDEYDEVLPAIHDTSAIVFVENIEDSSAKLGQRIDFKWVGTADSFQVIRRQLTHEGNEEIEIETVSYGAYRPAGSDTLECGCRYELTVISEQFGLTVTGQTRPIPPVSFLNDHPIYTHERNGDTLNFNYGTSSGIVWESDVRTTVYYIKLEKVLENDSLELVYRHPSFPIDELTRLNGGIPLGVEPIAADVFPGLYKLTVSVMDENYGRYFYSDLSLRDPAKSNLRDQDGHPILGAVGSVSDNHVFIRIK